MGPSTGLFGDRRWSAEAYVAMNVRLGETGDVRAIAELNDGTLVGVKRTVRVTVSGCGG